MATRVPPRARPLVRYVAFTIADGSPLGVVLSVGHDEQAATLLASKRWRHSQRQLTMVPWDDCLPHQRVAAARAELAEAEALARQVLR